MRLASLFIVSSPEHGPLGKEWRRTVGTDTQVLFQRCELRIGSQSEQPSFFFGSSYHQTNAHRFVEQLERKLQQEKNNRDHT